MFNVCKTSSKDCRPYLARVFSELRDLYDIKKAQYKPFKQDERCERELQGSGGGQKKHPTQDSTDKSEKQKKNSQEEEQPSRRMKKTRTRAKPNEPEQTKKDKKAYVKLKIHFNFIIHFEINSNGAKCDI